jgi:hypothetical protein
MTQRNEVLTREDNRISIISIGGATMQQDYVAVTEREMPVTRIEQTWILEAGEKVRAGRAIPQSANALVRITNWLGHLGSRKIDDGCLEARHNIHHNFSINGMGR